MEAYGKLRGAILVESWRERMEVEETGIAADVEERVSPGGKQGNDEAAGGNAGPGRR